MTGPGATSRAALLLAMLTTWLRPATAGRRTAHVGFLAAWLVHAGAAMIGALAFLFYFSWADGSWSADPSAILYRFESHLARFIRFATTRRGALIVVAEIISVQAAMIILTYVVMAWGARNESRGESFTATLRRVWLHTTHLTVVILAGVLAIFALHDAIRRQAQMFGNYPWYAQYKELIVFYICFLLVGWWLWALLRLVASDRPTRPVEGPPLCDRCGYNLTGTQSDATCPECGMAVIDSLGPDVRPGPVWQRRRYINRVGVYVGSLIEPIIAPDRFGRQLKLLQPGRDHHVFLLANLAVLALITVQGCLTLITVMSLVEGFATLVVWVNFPLMGSAFFVVLGLAIVLAGASLVGSFAGRIHNRNLLPASIQAACYLCGYLMIWSCIFWWFATVAAADFAHVLFRSLAEVYGVDMESIWVGTLWGGDALALAGYLFLIYRITAATRYSNK